SADDTSANLTFTQPDGKIVVVGTSAIVHNYYLFAALVVARYNADGTRDPSFGTGGLAIFDSSSPLYLGPTAVAVDGLGRVLVGGGGGLLRLNTNGTPDTTFGTGGKATVGVGIQSVAIDVSGRIVVAGSGVVARLTTGGALDSTFATNGKQTIDFTVS